MYTNGGGILIDCRLLDLGSEELRDLVHARARRRFNRGLKRKPMGLIKKLRKSKRTHHCPPIRRVIANTTQRRPSPTRSPTSSRLTSVT